MASRSRASTSAGPAVSTMTSSTPQSALTAARPPSVTTSSNGQSTPVVRRIRQRDRTCGRSRRPSTSSASAGDASSRADASAGATRMVCERRPSAGSTSVDGCSVFVSSRSWLTRHHPSRPGPKFTMMVPGWPVPSATREGFTHQKYARHMIRRHPGRWTGGFSDCPLLGRCAGRGGHPRGALRGRHARGSAGRGGLGAWRGAGPGLQRRHLPAGRQPVRSGRRADRRSDHRGPAAVRRGQPVTAPVAVGIAAALVLGGVIDPLVLLPAVLLTQVLLAGAWVPALQATSPIGGRIVVLGAAGAADVAVLAADETRPMEHVAPVLAVALLAALAHQLARRDGRGGLTTSLTATGSATVFACLGSAWLALDVSREGTGLLVLG